MTCNSCAPSNEMLEAIAQMQAESAMQALDAAMAAAFLQDPMLKPGLQKPGAQHVRQNSWSAASTAASDASSQADLAGIAGYESSVVQETPRSGRNSPSKLGEGKPWLMPSHGIRAPPGLEVGFEPGEPAYVGLLSLNRPTPCTSSLLPMFMQD
eukprot:TRINITY_DN24772_c0_g1_i1.p1 TRINITY_DN24772_c0_g1~~TRINITY_DN24772_c0_g1_i1.p1  ORF type:complete len:154 (+),score=31.43 TRINITY_DN24772_c0_g1_i1:112-573(+)